MEKDSKTTVAVERTTFAKLDRLAKANSVSKMEYITHAINYFEKYGINPVEHESPAQEMQKLIKRMDQVFAFLKKQETDLVRPACEALAGASTQITISLSSLLSEEKFRRFLKDNKELLHTIPNNRCRRSPNSNSSTFFYIHRVCYGVTFINTAALFRCSAGK